MTREEKIQWLVANVKAWSGDDGREVLEALSDGRIDSLIENAQHGAYYEAVANLAAQGFEHAGHHVAFDPEKESFVANALPGHTPTENRGLMTLNEMYDMGDQEVRSMIDNHRRYEAKARKDAIDKLVANARGPEARRLAAARYEKMSTDDLQELATALSTGGEGRAHYAGSPPPDAVTNADGQDVLVPAAQNYAESASPRLLAAFGRNGG